MVAKRRRGSEVQQRTGRYSKNNPFQNARKCIENGVLIDDEAARYNRHFYGGQGNRTTCLDAVCQFGSQIASTDKIGIMKSRLQYSSSALERGRRANWFRSESSSFQLSNFSANFRCLRDKMCYFRLERMSR